MLSHQNQPNPETHCMFLEQLSRYVICYMLVQRRRTIVDQALCIHLLPDNPLYVLTIPAPALAPANRLVVSLSTVYRD